MPHDECGVLSVCIMPDTIAGLLGDWWRDRVAQPLYRTFALSWVAWNWKAFYITFAVDGEILMNLHEVTKLEYLLCYYTDLWWHGALLWLIGPLGTSFLLIVWPLPRVARWFYSHYLDTENKDRDTKELYEARRRKEVAEETKAASQDELEAARNEVEVAKLAKQKADETTEALAVAMANKEKELALARKELELAQANQQVAITEELTWDEEYERFKQEGGGVRYDQFQDILRTILDNYGRIWSEGRPIYPGATLFYFEESGIINHDSEDGRVWLTPKGKHFAKLHIRDNPDWQ